MNTLLSALASAAKYFMSSDKETALHELLRSLVSHIIEKESPATELPPTPSK